MKAIKLTDRPRLEAAVPIPELLGESRVKVIAAGICNTDLEIIKGYAGFQGTLGHEFVGRVVNSDNEQLIGQRVTGEINAGCNRCHLCLQGDARHCACQTVLGIKGRDGCFAEFLSLPERNLIQVPDSLTDEEAVFIEPVAAACEILDQVDINPRSRVAVIGDGKLGQLIVRVLATTGCELTVLGKHDHKLRLAATTGATIIKISPANPLSERSAAGNLASISPELNSAPHSFDVVVEASGSPSGLEMALWLVRPRGTVVLKSTHHDRTNVDLSQVVVNEVTLVGSRCGRFEKAIELLGRPAIRVDDLISGRFSLDEWEAAFAKAAEPLSLKVILTM